MVSEGIYTGPVMTMTAVSLRASRLTIFSSDCHALVFSPRSCGAMLAIENEWCMAVADHFWSAAGIMCPRS